MRFGKEAPPETAAGELGVSAPKEGSSERWSARVAIWWLLWSSLLRAFQPPFPVFPSGRLPTFSFWRPLFLAGHGGFMHSTEARRRGVTSMFLVLLGCFVLTTSHAPLRPHEKRGDLPATGHGADGTGLRRCVGYGRATGPQVASSCCGSSAASHLSYGSTKDSGWSHLARRVMDDLRGPTRRNLRAAEWHSSQGMAGEDGLPRSCCRAKGSIPAAGAGGEATPRSLPRPWRRHFQPVVLTHHLS